MRKKLQNILHTSILLACFTIAKGQDHKHLPTFLQNLWQNGENPAAVLYNPYKSSGSTSIGYSATSGGFHSIYAPQQINRFQFDAKADTIIGKNAFFGYFHYLNSNENGLKWNNTSMISGDNPFILADSIGGNYDKEEFKLNGGYSSHFGNNKHSWAIQFGYRVGSKADQNDPRPEIRSSRASIAPGIIVSLNKWQLGLSLWAENFNEEINITIVDHYINYRYFRFMGFGMYQGTTDSYFERVYSGYKYGGEIQGRYQSKTIENFAHINIKNTYERAQEGAATTKYLAGDFKSIRATVNNQLLIKHNRAIHHIRFEGSYSNTKGIWFDQEQKTNDLGTTIWDVYFQSVRYKERKLRTIASYEYIRRHQNLKKYSIAAHVAFNTSNAWFYPEKFNKKYSNITTRITANKNITSFSHFSVSLKLDTWLRRNLKNNLYIHNIELSDLITKPLHAYHSANLYGFNACAIIEFENLFPNKITPYIEAAASQTRSSANNPYFPKSQRTSFNIKIGLIL